ncbi:MAG: hypothetical protein E7465_05130 [Ruminococcaceae bacterium]|nr:hypothetical protein [Oscillospiraceae bacterium]
MKRLYRLLCLILSIVMVLGVFTVSASAEEIAAGAADPNTPKPYIYRRAEAVNGKVVMSGKAYYDAIRFYMAGGNNTGVIAYNFKGLYKSLTFDAGFVSGLQKDAEMTVTADGIVVYNTTIGYDEVAKSHTISLVGVHQLIISLKSSYDSTKYYAIGKIKAEPAATLPTESVLLCSEGYDDCQYVLRRAAVVSGPFQMGGNQYRGGYDLRTWGGNSDAYVCYDFNGQYGKMTFDIARYAEKSLDSSTDTRLAYLTITLDGMAVAEYDNRQIGWNDLCLPVELDLTGVSQVVIRLKSTGNDTLHWRMGNIQISSAPGVTPTQEVLTSCEGFDYYQYLLSQAAVITGKFSMGGEHYKGGYELSTWGGNSTAKVCYNFSGKCKEISFDIARFADSPIDGNLMDRVAYLTITVDGEAVAAYDERQIKWNDLSLPVKLDLNGASQVIITLKSTGENTASWRMGNIQIVCVEHTYDDNVDGICNICSVHRETVETRQVVHMFRMFNPNTGEHFYTGSEVEKNNLLAVGWKYEGIGFTFPANTGAPVHRLFQPSTGEHLYTMDNAEKERLMADGWNYEGVAFNSAYDTEAVQHRLHNPNATVGAYHFTFSLEEKQNLINAGWEYQGIGWYSCWK